MIDPGDRDPDALGLAISNGAGRVVADVEALERFCRCVVELSPEKPGVVRAQIVE